MVIYLGRGADLHIAQLMPLPLTISCSGKSRLVLPFWYRLTQVFPDSPGSHKMVVVVVVVVVSLSLNLLQSALKIHHILNVNHAVF